jgi:cytochrome c-type biogenesis protein CcmF
MAGWQSDRVLAMRPGESVEIAGKRVTMTAARTSFGPNYEAAQARFSVATLGGTREMISERRLFPASQTTTTAAAINVGAFGNLYISVGDPSPGGGVVVRLWNHPFVNCIWGGAFLMALGGMASLADRRLRYALVRRARPVAGVLEPARSPAHSLP